ncbi:hypothetical protein GLOTRDRAFT_109943 [Gloeophyllum trabeum ATCC 11539]|uniref:RRM domain-containing protein n=1 Tax=Gloeophyllum trabeum (strain ATCC 11539 / FP-39264 / Madison 617) TaxID=670483 RepID=S7QF26_GLOTA|nr:uncharacterized protein GLOTRDRAFT_109943 [Gloeophyllum trabeum ATCC 11539]EPQ57913.1 hypothetical protein GLOTRDRAFT_109943 [Gloeophyllum trabeum ATCC 11539]
MARRLYLGKLPADARTDDVSKMFEGYGRIVDCRVMTGFGFVEFENPRDAEDAVHHFNGKQFMGASIVVEFAKETRRTRGDVYEGDRRGPAPRSKRPPGIRLIVAGISRDTSWQDLKDFGREAGSVSYADIDRDYPGNGILEYLSRDDADRAVKDLDGKELRGRAVRVTYDDSRATVDNYRRDDRRDDRRGGYERSSYRDDRVPHRRERSRSPAGRRAYDHDDRRPRSPPPPKREHDDRRPAGDDYERRRDDRPRREERDDRYDDRSSRAAPVNGDAGWSRQPAV